MIDPEAPRRRALKYLSLWAIDADATPRPELALERVAVRSATEVAERVMALTLVALKGQGLDQHETFAFADSFEVWDALSVAENEFVLDPSPSRHDLVQSAWRFEATWALLWALGVVRHLIFPDRPSDSGKAVQLVLSSVAPAETRARATLRPLHELVEGAEVALRLADVAHDHRRRGDALPSGLDMGVVHERCAAFEWLLRLRDDTFDVSAG